MIEQDEGLIGGVLLRGSPDCIPTQHPTHFKLGFPNGTQGTQVYLKMTRFSSGFLQEISKRTNVGAFYGMVCISNQILEFGP